MGQSYYDRVAYAGHQGGRAKYFNYYQDKAFNIMRALWFYEFTDKTQAQIAKKLGLSQGFVSRFTKNAEIRMRRLINRTSNFKPPRGHFKKWILEREQQYKYNYMIQAGEMWIDEIPIDVLFADHIKQRQQAAREATASGEKP